MSVAVSALATMGTITFIKINQKNKEANNLVGKRNYSYAHSREIFT